MIKENYYCLPTSFFKKNFFKTYINIKYIIYNIYKYKCIYYCLHFISYKDVVTGLVIQIMHTYIYIINTT